MVIIKDTTIIYTLISSCHHLYHFCREMPSQVFYSSVFYFPLGFWLLSHLCLFSLISTNILKRLLEVCSHHIKKRIFFKWLSNGRVYIQLILILNISMWNFWHWAFCKAFPINTLWSQHYHTVGEKEDMWKIYIADRDFYVLCALHLYFQLKASDYFLKEFRLSWGRLKIMSIQWFIKWISKWKWTDWYWFLP